MNLEQHRVLVTGGTRGIGFELATLLLGRGAEVAVCGRDPEGLATARRRLPALAAALHCDLDDIDALPPFVDELRSSFGSPTVLVNNAGIQYNHPWTDTDSAEVVERLRREIRVNLTGPLVLTALLLSDLIGAEESAVVNVSSTLALTPKRSAPVYCATKAAIRSFSRALRDQLEPHSNVQVIEVLPPLVDTGMTAGRGSGKMSAPAAAEEIVVGLERNRREVYVGKAKVLRVLHRLVPGVAARLLRDG